MPQNAAGSSHFGHFRPVEPDAVVAIATRVLLQVLLVGLVRRDEFRCLPDVRAGLGAFEHTDLLGFDECVDLVAHLLGDLLLLVRVVEDHRRVLSTPVVALSIRSRGVVEREQMLHQILVRRLRRIVCNVEHLNVSRLPRAHQSVCVWIVGGEINLSAHEADFRLDDRSREHLLEVLVVVLLRSPIASRTCSEELRLLRGFRIGSHGFAGRTDASHTLTQRR
mmetsp:Transcript_6194/g.13477  ORF Transcript_6194/g.13477 Transcript_6194/m.13477 type:complete len:222 (+) Transcript_6194:48-713(+)